MTDETFAFYASAFDLDSNIHTVYIDPDTGETVVLVLDDAPALLAPYATRALNVKIVKAPMFKAPPPDDLKPLDIPTKRFRPAPAGVSCGSYRITAGTLGLVVWDKINQKKAVLSNNHVLADVDAGRVGDDIVQPGIADGGVRLGDTIARLTRWQPLRTSTTRLIDAAIADVIRDEDVSLNVNELGYVYGIVDPYPHQQVTKSGRTTVLSRGEVAAVGAKVRVDYGAAGVISLDDCIILNLYSAPGDSGSPILDFCSHNLVGLLFAGNGLQTIACMASHIARLLDVEIIQPPEIMASMWVDVSRWQGVIDWSKMVTNGVRGVIMKVCQANFADVRFAENYAGAKDADLLVGGYIYVDPAHSAQVHYDTFVQTVGAREFDLPVALDIEQASGQSKTTITAVLQQLSSRIALWQGGQLPFIYTSLGFWNDNVSAWSGWANHPLWMAYWTTREVYRPPVPYSWQDASGHNLPGKPELWQVGPMDIGQYMGVDSVQLDVNKSFRGLEPLIKGVEPPPPPEEVTLTLTIEGNGFVSPGGGKYPGGSVVTLQATPADGWRFDSWGGDASGNTNPLVLTLNSDMSIVVRFVEDTGGPAVFEHTKARATVNLNYRTAPSTTATRLGTMPAGTTVEDLEERTVTGNLWARIGLNQWACKIYNGAVYLADVMPGDPQALALPPSRRERVRLWFMDVFGFGGRG